MRLDYKKILRIMVIILLDVLAIISCGGAALLARFDFSFEREGKTCFLEVKGVTLEHEGVCAFPDAPTERGARHLQHLAQLAREGYETWALFVIQMEDVKYLHPNDATDPAFGKALREAAQSGVRVMAVDCGVTVDSMVIGKEVPVKL